MRNIRHKLRTSKLETYAFAHSDEITFIHEQNNTLEVQLYNALLLEVWS